MFGTHLSAAFIVASSHISMSGRKEIPLFNALVASFSSLSSMGLDITVLSPIIHKVYGNFDVDKSYFTGGLLNKKREIGDLVLVMYSKKKQSGKITFIQCKHHKSLSIVPPSVFKGENLQFYLMNKRPIVYKCKYPMLDLNPTLFQKATIPSVTSYGIFYDFKGKHEFAYYSSDHLIISGVPFTAIRKTQSITFTGSYCHVDPSYPLGDVNGTRDMIEFGDHIEKLNIGTILGSGLQNMIKIIHPNAPASFKSLEFEFRNDEPSIRNDLLAKKPIIFINVDNLTESKNI